jgi:hypothetical protein
MIDVPIIARSLRQDDKHTEGDRFSGNSFSAETFTLVCYFFPNNWRCSAYDECILPEV